MVSPQQEPNQNYLYLTTIGRTSGNPREIEIWFVEREGMYYILAENPDANWVKNIRKTPQVQVRIGGSRFAAMARVLDERLDRNAWQTAQRLEREKYGWGEGLPVEIVPDEN